ncbi:MAG: hypothetical protein KU37_03405 [Sulfuricurvum sp. PC08-66]|nr:MAG: hypothetical protein KU37_03405 [Sulfuricurvum sp. PC08-66]
MNRLLLLTFGAVSMLFGTIDQTLSTNIQSTQNTQISQTKIDALNEEERSLFMEYRNALREIETLKTYNGQLQSLIATQEEESKGLQEQIVEIEITQQRIMPLMQEMIDTLVAFVGQDIPFLAHLRQEKRERLEELLAKANLTVSQKYRYIVEAYANEMEYGRTIEAYEDTLPSGQNVIFLRIGRTALYYLTRDESEAAIYDRHQKAFVTLSSGYIPHIKRGIKIARKQLAPDVLRLPIIATKEH